jgi:hypothetical protein
VQGHKIIGSYKPANELFSPYYLSSTNFPGTIYYLRVYKNQLFCDLAHI